MSELAVDSSELAAALGTLRQGDILDVAKIVVLYSPDALQYPEEAMDVPAEEPVMTRETRLQPGLVGIVSGTCELRRTPDAEPYVLVAPLTVVDALTYGGAARGQSSRFFAYPSLPEHEDEHLVLDLRLVNSIEKSALASPHITKTIAPLSEPERERLRIFLGDRLGRPTFPDEVHRQVIQPIERAFKRLAGQDAARGFLDSVCYIGLRWMPGKQFCSMLVLTDPSRRAANKVNQPEMDGGKRRLTDALDHFTRDGDYNVTPYVHDVSQVSATEILEHEELRLDVDLAP